MNCKRRLYFKTYRVGRYKAIRTSGHDSGITIYVKKRFLGFLWWIFIKDANGCPVCYNHDYNAEAFMKGVIKYDDMLHYIHKGEGKRDVRPMTDEDAWVRISEKVEEIVGDAPEIECVQRAWEFDGKQYCLEAAKYAALWHRIYKERGTRIWEA